MNAQSKQRGKMSTERHRRMGDLLAKTRAEAEHIIHREETERPGSPEATPSGTVKTPVTVAEHGHWQRGLSSESQADDLDDDLINVDPYSGDPPNRRSDKELGRVLSILDELEAERGKPL